MRENPDDAGPAIGTTSDTPALLWTAAAAVAGLGSWVLFDARPGVNWGLWTGAAVAGLLLLARRSGHPLPPIRVTGGAAVVIAGATTVTASEVVAVLVCASVLVFLAMQMLLLGSASLRPITMWFAALAPLLAFRAAVVQAMRRVVEATNGIRSTRAREWVRGVAITLPVLIAFALLLAGADPIFAGWRDTIARLVASWAFLPRVLFFVALLVVVLGAYGHASTEPAHAPAKEETAPARWLGSTERLMLLAGVAALLWLFLAVQLGYLFGNLPRLATSGVTFAEYARRGFAELSIVASASALLIVVSERYGTVDGRERRLRVLTGAVIAAVMLLLGSAFRRVWLYEAAYGYTTARLYAQVYMCAVAAGLVMLALEIGRDFDAGRLFRRAAAATALLFVGLVYWNHEGWIARRNIDRFERTGKLDVVYLARELSADAIPSIAARLPSLPEPVRSELRRAVRERHALPTDSRPDAWFEWNLARSRARRALARSF